MKDDAGNLVFPGVGRVAMLMCLPSRLAAVGFTEAIIHVVS
jgi:hypothetical protein